jgi:hypothetical protein
MGKQCDKSELMLLSLDHEMQIVVFEAITNVEVTELLGAPLMVECETRPLK